MGFFSKVCKIYKIETEIFTEDLNKLFQGGEGFLKNIFNND